jgi:hypothetical protein
MISAVGGFRAAKILAVLAIRISFSFALSRWALSRLDASRLL